MKNSEKLKPKLKIFSIVGRKNFKCKYLQEKEFPQYKTEKDAKLYDIFSGKRNDRDKTCDNLFLPCKIEIKEKNLPRIKVRRSTS